MSYYVGSDNNDLKRYYEASKVFNLDIIVRIISDCPFFDPILLDEIIAFYNSHDYDSIRNIDGKNAFPIGLDMEIFSFQTLDIIFQNAKTKYEKEHVNPYILNHPELFTIFIYNSVNHKLFIELRFTIDYKEDLEMLREVYKKLMEDGKSINFSIHDLFKIIEKYPEIIDMNKKYEWKD